MAVRLMLPMDHSDTASEPVDLEAVVVRREEVRRSNGRREEVRRSNGRQRYDIALYFTNVDPSAHDQLKRYLDHHAD